MIDSHLHLDDQAFDGKVDEIVSRFDEFDVKFVINNSSDYPTMLSSVALADKYPKIFATIGMHPHTSKDFDQKFAGKMFELANNPKVVAVGEIGLDYHYDLSDRQIQRDVFARQLEIADKLGLPVTLHVREAYGDADDILTAQKKYLNHGVLWHCYSGSEDFAKQMVKRGHYFAFGGAITFKSAKKESVIAAIPTDRILCETDSPYMAPAPFRGTVNTPFNIPLIVEKIASVYGITTEQADEIILNNCLTLFPKIAEYLAANNLD